METWKVDPLKKAILQINSCLELDRQRTWSRIFIWATKVPFLVPLKQPKMTHFGCFGGYQKWQFGCSNQNSDCNNMVNHPLKSVFLTFFQINYKTRHCSVAPYENICNVEKIRTTHCPFPSSLPGRTYVMCQQSFLLNPLMKIKKNTYSIEGNTSSTLKI